MALVNTYFDPNVTASGYGVNSRSRNVRQGADDQIMTTPPPLVGTYNVNSTDNIGSVYRLFKNVDANFVPTEFWIGSGTNITSLVASAGLYLPNGSLTAAPSSGGAAILMAATALSTAAAPLPGSGVNGLGALWLPANLAMNWDARLFEIAGGSLVDAATPPYGNPRQYDICLTVTTAPTANGIIYAVLKGYMG